MGQYHLLQNHAKFFLSTELRTAELTASSTANPATDVFSCTVRNCKKAGPPGTMQDAAMSRFHFKLHML
jgi:hypothetical protein